MVQTTRAVPPPLPMHRVATAAASSSTLSSGPAYHVVAAPGDFLARLEELEKGAEPAPLWGGAPTMVPAAEPPLKMLAPKQLGHVVGRAIGQVPADRSDCLPWFHRDHGLRRLVLLPIARAFIEPCITGSSIFARLQLALQHRGATAGPSARPPVIVKDNRGRAPSSAIASQTGSGLELAGCRARR